jgi:hypothetical protein
VAWNIVFAPFGSDMQLIPATASLQYAGVGAGVFSAQSYNVAPGTGALTYIPQSVQWSQGSGGQVVLVPGTGLLTYIPQFASGVAPRTFYTTSFPLTENPISENGIWTNTADSSLTKVKTEVVLGTHIAHGTMGGHAVPPYNDSSATLTGFPPDHVITGTIWLNPSVPASPNVEIELHLRWTEGVTPWTGPYGTFTVHGYEININQNDGYFYLNRFGEAPVTGGFPYPSSVNVTPVKTGDVLYAEVSTVPTGAHIVVKWNGVTCIDVIDTNPYLGGNPGIGFYTDPGGADNWYGFSSITASTVGMIDQGLNVIDPYSSVPAWYVDGANGTDVTQPGVAGPNGRKPAGYVYRTYDNALLDVFYASGATIGQRRIIVRPFNGVYYPGGNYHANIGSYFPAGGADAAHPFIIQGDPTSAVLPKIDGRASTACDITNITNSNPVRVYFSDPLYGPAENPFSVGQKMQIAGVYFAPTNANPPTVPYTGGMHKMNEMPAGGWTVTNAGGSAGSWWVEIGAVNSTIDNVDWFAYDARGKTPATGFPNDNGDFVCAPTSAVVIGAKGGYGAADLQIANVTMRKLDIGNGLADMVYCYFGAGGTGTSSNVVAEYCDFHDIYYPPAHPSGTGGFGCPNNETANYLTLRNCKFRNIGLRVGYTNWADTDGTHYSGNCVGFETYGSRNVTFQNNLFENISGIGGIFLKLAGYHPNNCDNWTVANNIFKRCMCGFAYFGASGNSIDPASNVSFTGNLFHTAHPNGSNSVGFGGSTTSGQPRGSNVEFSNNTVAEDMHGSFGWLGATDVRVKDNVILGLIGRQTKDGVAVANEIVNFSYFDHNFYGSASNAANSWELSWNDALYLPGYTYASFDQWKVAYSSPVGRLAPTPPPELASVGDPDQNGGSILQLTAPFNTVAYNFPNMGTRDYTLRAGSPLLTRSSTGGRVGYDPTNCGPGW